MIQIDVRLDYWFEQQCDVLLQVEVADMPGQRIETSAITVSPQNQLIRVPA
jgi:hypothetical protein